MHYTQLMVRKTGTDFFMYYNTKDEAKRAAKRAAKNNDYSCVWYGDEMLRIPVKLEK